MSTDWPTFSLPLLARPAATPTPFEKANNLRRIVLSPSVAALKTICDMYSIWQLPFASKRNCHSGNF